MIKDNKIKGQRKVLQLSAAFFMGCLVLASCKKEYTNVGDGLEESSLDVQQTDTFSLVTYSAVEDSLETDETAVNLLGAYMDPVFGKVDCGIVTQIRLSAVNPEFGPTATLVMDSVVLSLAYTGIKYYANLDPITVEVYRLNEDIDRDEGTYYAFDTPATTGGNLVEPGFENSGWYEPDVIGEQILADDTLPAHLRIRLDPSVGMDFVNANDAGQLSSNEAFVSFFKGLYIKVNGAPLSPGQGTVLYFVMENSLTNLTMYFHDSGDLISKRFTFPINSSCARYNYIQFDRTGTHVEQVIQDPSNGSEAFYMQGSSVSAVVSIPHLMSFNYDSLNNWDPKIINRAELVLPVQDFGPDPFDPSISLFISKIGPDGELQFTLDYPSVSGQLSVVAYDQDKKEYRFTLTRELQAILTGDRENTAFLIRCPGFFGSSIERVIFNGSDATLKEQPRLEITYTNY